MFRPRGLLVPRRLTNGFGAILCHISVCVGAVLLIRGILFVQSHKFYHSIGIFFEFIKQRILLSKLSTFKCGD